MSLLTKITDVIGGSLFGSVKELITDYFPPDMSPEKKAELQRKIDEMEFKKQIAILEATADAEKTLNQRIAEQEGTASDLKQLPIVGRIVLFLRGLQRPMWGFFVMYIDFEWFTKAPTYTEQQQSALIVINLLVLGFLFGERTITNLKPLIVEVFGRGR
ncbi:hypothetical protein [Photobacterium profundum]|uniref:Coil containing protein n=1 Tax=Photobacterium profundum (strain SS9) TaxID=298386 RepID=Q6LSI4_PHOPR|nr:hypothetical protein [Photobacterium profundum]CAG19742.1 Hypothetical protein PBPRA1331 [Photobacterium profundum SS9]